MTIHVIRPGDNIYAVAQRYGVPPQQIIDENEITSPQSLAVGEAIVIPTPPEKRRAIDVNGYAYPFISSYVLNATLPYLTYLSAFSYEVRPDGSLVPIPDEQVTQTARFRGVAPLMVISNIGEDGTFDSDLAHGILASPDIQEVLLGNVVELLAARNYYGLDVDFEYIRAQDRENYNNFLRLAAGRLHALGYMLSTALAPKTSDNMRGTLYEGHDYATQGEIVDHITLMTYEYGYTYGPPQAVAPINQVEPVIRYAASVIPPQKLWMGIPNYGYDWTLPYTPGTAAQSLSNTGAVELARRVGAAIRYDTAAQAPYFNYYDEQGRQHVVWFEDARSIKAKLDLMERYGLAGVSYWNINSFFPQNWLVLDGLYNINKVV